jgi:septum site-determining protein MinD
MIETRTSSSTITCPEITLSKIIAVHSLQRSVGKSTIVANLAVLMAMNGYRVGLLDTDFESPASHYLFGLTETYTDCCLNDYLAGKCDIQQATYDVTPHLVNDVKGRIYITPASIEVPQMMNAAQKGLDLQRLSDGLDELNSKLAIDIILMDTHAGLSEQTLGIIAMSDALLVVLRPEQQIYQGVGVTLGLARKLEIPQLALIINQLPLVYDPQQAKSQVESTFSCPVVAVLPFSDEIIHLTSSSIFVTRYPQHLITSQLKQAADALIADIEI